MHIIVYGNNKSRRRGAGGPSKKQDMETRKLKIRDLTLRDGQQSLFATRLSQAEIDKLLPYYENAGFYIMEVWGGAVPDSVMRYLDESIT